MERLHGQDCSRWYSPVAASLLPVASLYLPAAAALDPAFLSSSPPFCCCILLLDPFLHFGVQDLNLGQKCFPAVLRFLAGTEDQRRRVRCLHVVLVPLLYQPGNQLDLHFGPSAPPAWCPLPAFSPQYSAGCCR